MTQREHRARFRSGLQRPTSAIGRSRSQFKPPRSQHGLRWRRARMRKPCGRWNRRQVWKIGRRKVW
jgi:hypothetical protein